MSKKKMPLKLNLGCGSNKLDGFVNVDIEASCKPDAICNFITDPLPYKTGTVNEVVLFHTIEHISKPFQTPLLKEIHRVLKPSGRFLVSYPEFSKCYENWKNNYLGKRDFWEATLYGRQLYASDFHVCIMHTPAFLDVLRDVGFDELNPKSEPGEFYNTVISCIKVKRPPQYIDQLTHDIKNLKIKIKKGGSKCK